MPMGMAYYISIYDLIGQHYYIHMYSYMYQLYTGGGTPNSLSLQVPLWFD